MSSRVGFSFAVLVAFVAGIFLIGPIAKAAEDAVQGFTCKSKKSACVISLNKATGAAVAGESKGVGVAGFGSSTPAPGAGATGLGVYGQGAKQGVVGLSATGAGVTGIAGVPPSGGTFSGYGVIGNGANYGVLGAGPGVGVLANSSSTTSSVFALQAVSFTGASLFQATNGSTGLVTIAPSGSIATTGTITTSGSCHVGCVVNQRVESYAISGATRTLEDTGEAQLRGGAAYVRLSPDFANAIEPSRGYLVLVTPEDETRGVYVTGRSMQGFMVRENPGGHSDAQFAYRIVAHPYGDRSPRLPFRTLVFHR